MEEMVLWPKSPLMATGDFQEPHVGDPKKPLDPSRTPPGKRHVLAAVFVGALRGMYAGATYGGVLWGGTGAVVGLVAGFVHGVYAGGIERGLVQALYGMLGGGLAAALCAIFTGLVVGAYGEGKAAHAPSDDEREASAS
jgi:hypothetical protein